MGYTPDTDPGLDPDSRESCPKTPGTAQGGLGGLRVWLILSRVRKEKEGEMAARSQSKSAP